MPPVFCRYLPDPHPYDDALNAMRAAGEGEAAVAVNLMYDCRVSPAREAAFDALVSTPPTADSLQVALTHYQLTNVQKRKLPHYVYEALNAGNLLNGRVGVLPAVKSSVQLVRVLDLNGLWKVFQWAQTEGEFKYPGRWGKTFDTFPTSYSPLAEGGGGEDEDKDPLMKYLKWKMEGRSVEDFVVNVLDLLDVFGRGEKNPFQPTWATTWAAFEPYAAEGPDRWHQVLGMDKPGSRWLVLLKYTVQEAGTVARPTQLDAGWYDSHFPSPPDCPRSEGGHPMDLSASPDILDRPLLPEYVHKQIHHLPGHWTSLAPQYKNYGRTTARPLPPLPAQRLAHHERLQRRYGRASVCGWMSSPM